jgi:hypothetical protein
VPALQQCSIRIRTVKRLALSSASWAIDNLRTHPEGTPIPCPSCPGLLSDDRLKAVLIRFLLSRDAKAFDYIQVQLDTQTRTIRDGNVAVVHLQRTHH